MSGTRSGCKKARTEETTASLATRVRAFLRSQGPTDVGADGDQDGVKAAGGSGPPKKLTVHDVLTLGEQKQVAAWLKLSLAEFQRQVSAAINFHSDKQGYWRMVCSSRALAARIVLLKRERRCMFVALQLTEEGKVEQAVGLQ